jgi:predicted DsbA family dithiol-disulfide isomerase
MARTVARETRDVPEAIQWFFDPMCPYAYQASIWIRDVRTQTPIDITWRFFSLESINREEGKREPWERPWSYGWGQMRVGALIRREQGNDALDRWYATIGPAFFERGEKTFDPEVHKQIIADAGFDADLVDRAIDDDTTSDDVKADHAESVQTYGAHGVPTIVFESGYAVYGPVVVPAPRGDDALALWALVRGMQRFPHLYELRHPKTGPDLANIAEHFGTYVRARAWRTIENPAP